MGEGFGRYREIAVLGRGGMARVVLVALDGPHNVQKLLVIKEVLPELATDPEFKAMFTEEARIASRLDHPNVIHTFELVEEKDRCFFVMEYLEGQSLSAILTRTKRDMPLPIFLRIMTRLLAGLHYAHELADLDGTPLCLVHRDVTPQNIFVAYGGSVKLVDFGIAKAAGAAIRTRTGVFKGKLAYAAAEQLANDPIDRRADIFAAGVILWEGLAKRRLTKGLTEPEILAQRITGDPTLSSVAPDTAPPLLRIADKAIAREPAHRFTTAAEMQTAIEKAIDDLGLRTTDEDVGKYVIELFGEERSKVRQLIQERLAQPSSDTTSAPLLPRAADSARSTSEKLVPSSARTRAADLRTDMTQSMASSAQRGGRRRRAMYVALAVLLAFGGVGLFFKYGKASSTSSSSSSSSAASQESSSTLVAISIRVAPSLARITLDDVDLGQSAYEGRLTRDAKEHKLVVTAPGFQPSERSLLLDRDVRLEIALTPLAIAIVASDDAGTGVRPLRVVPGMTVPILPNPHAPHRPPKPIETNDPYGGR